MVEECIVFKRHKYPTAQRLTLHTCAKRVSFVVGDTKAKKIVETNIMYVYDYDSASVNNKIKMLSDFKLYFICN